MNAKKGKFIERFESFIQTSEDYNIFNRKETLELKIKAGISKQPSETIVFSLSNKNKNANIGISQIWDKKVNDNTDHYNLNEKILEKSDGLCYVPQINDVGNGNREALVLCGNEFALPINIEKKDIEDKLTQFRNELREKGKNIISKVFQ
jgi:hypothetical protein